MSIVVIPGAAVPNLSDAEFESLLASAGIRHLSSADKAAYKSILQSFLAVMRKIDEDPDYTPPSLDPVPATADRSYTAPTPEENPMNAWSHLCNIQDTNVSAKSPGPMQGRIIAIKDNISVAGLPTTIGLSPKLFEGGQYLPATVDATVVARLLEAGAVIRGTSTCEGWCASPLSFTSFTGPVHNPWLYGYSAGGSSSGSAALVAAHEMQHIFPCNNSDTLPFGTQTNTLSVTTAEIAIGSDQAGSVRIPASYCGIYGLKPTFGLVPYTGAASMSPMIDHLGPMASKLEDIAVALQTIAGYDGLDPRMSPESPLQSGVKPYAAILAHFRTQVAANSPKWNIGLLREGFEMDGVTAAVRDTVLSAARTCFAAAGANVVEISVPMHVNGSVLWNAATRPSMATWLLQGRCSGHLTYVPQHIQPVTSQLPISGGADGMLLESLLTKHTPAAINILLSQQVSNATPLASLEAKAHRQLLGLRAAYDVALEQVDVLITPCAPNVASKLPSAMASVAEKLAYAIGTTSNTAPFNATGHPAMNVPCGFSPSDGDSYIPLPVGMQVIGKRFEDEKLLLAAALYEHGRHILKENEVR